MRQSGSVGYGEESVRSFSYDAAGNLQAYAGDSYVFDAENRLTTVAGVTYSYDGDGRRVKKSNGTLYWYGTNALDPVMETDLSGNNAEEFVFFNGRRTARRDAAGAISYFFADHLGSPRVVQDSVKDSFSKPIPPGIRIWAH